MHPILNIEKSYNTWNAERISRHILYWLAWTMFYMIVNTNYGNQNTYLEWLAAEMHALPIKWVFVYTVIYVLMPKFFFKKQYVVFFSILIPLALLGGTIIRYLLVNHVYPEYFEITKVEEPIFSFRVVGNTLDLIYIAALVAIIKLVQHNKKQEQKQQELFKQRISAELQLLKNQLHPHFLFNTLNNLYGMALTKDDKTPDVIIRLSNLMSYMLYECDVPKIALSKEIEHLKNYIELEKIRYNNQLEVVFEVAGEIQDKMIAPLLLLPFIENAFKHGASKEDKPMWMNINIWSSIDKLSFTIENSLPDEVLLQQEKIKTQSGIGLQNVRKRLDLLYPSQYQLSILEEGSFLVKLEVEL